MAHPRNFDSEFHSKNWPTSQEAAQKKIEGENANEIEEFKRHCDETDLLCGAGCIR